LTRIARGELRQKFLDADLGITDATSPSRRRARSWLVTNEATGAW